MEREFAFIETIRKRARKNYRSSHPIIGIGDDAAVLAQSTDTESLVTTDLLIEEVDFKRDYVVPAWLGHKVLAVSLSDIAAMGGRPRFSFLSLGIPPHFGTGFWGEFFDGYFALADRYDVVLSGGDTSSSPDRLVCDSMVIGECARGGSVRRNAARVGDDIWVTGTLGSSLAGLKLLLEGKRVQPGISDAIQKALQRHLRPDPPLEFGGLLGQHGLAHSMIDVSDGFTQDLNHICESSGTSAEIERDLIPVAPEMSLITTNVEEAFSLAISGGEDYELLFTATPEDNRRVLQLAEQTQVDVRVVGRIVERREHSLYLVDRGQQEPLTPRGYEHFS